MNFLKFTFLLTTLFLFSTNIQAQVKAFGPTGYNGQGVELKPGKYVYSQLQKRGLSTLGGLRVPIGCDVKVYTSPNLQGEAKRFSKSNAKINKSGDYSLKVACGSIGAQPALSLIHI